MENIVNIKRRAQKLVQDGNYVEAIEQYTMLVEMGDLDPYDYVVLGDLLLRDSRKYDAVGRYREALAAYTRGGLHRNAIAIAKRIRRLVPENSAVQRQLGDLYAAEGLHTEASLHYMEYLERAKGEEDFADAVEEVGMRLLDSTLPSFELIPRIVAAAREAGRGEKLADGVLRQARMAGRQGQDKVETTLVDLACSLDADVMGREGTAAAAPAPHAPHAPMFDPGVVKLNDASVQAFPEDPSAVLLPGIDENFSQRDSGNGSAPELGVVSLDPDDSGVSLGDGLDLGVPAPAEPLELEHPAAVVERAERAAHKGDVLVAQREFLRAASEYLRAGDLEAADEQAGRVVALDPNHLEALRLLVDVAQQLGNTEKIARYGCELGDVYLAREMYAEARGQFEQVLIADPDNAKAHSRLNRLESLDRTDAEDELRVADELDASTVTVRDDSTAPTQTAMDLAAILEEFRSAVVERIPAEDSRAHYDMGMSYLEMGLTEDALTEFELAAEDAEIRTRALEMMVECSIKLNRGQEALEVLRDLLGVVEDDAGLSRLALAQGRAYELLGLDDEAQNAYFRALELDENLTVAFDRLTEIERRRNENAA